MVCTFFGHRDTPQHIMPLLKSAVETLITQKDVTTFYVGNNGCFDRMAEMTLKELKNTYPHIRQYVVLAYLPTEKQENGCQDFTDTVYPDGLERVPQKYAVAKRNEWMLKRADFVVAYVIGSAGGAARFKELAENKGKTVINLAVE